MLKTRQSQRQAFNKCKEPSPDHTRELEKKAFLKSEQNNPQHVPEVNKNAQKRKRSLMSELNPSDHDLLHPFTKRPSCAADNEIHEFKC